MKFEPEVALGWLTPHFVHIEVGNLHFEEGYFLKGASRQKMC